MQILDLSFLIYKSDLISNRNKYHVNIYVITHNNLCRLNENTYVIQMYC